MRYCSRFAILSSGFFALDIRSNVGVLGRLVDKASPRNGDLAADATDSISKYAGLSFFSCVVTLSVGGIVFVLSGVELYK